MDEKLKACGLELECSYDDILVYCRKMAALDNFSHMEITYALAEHYRIILWLMPEVKDYHLAKPGDGRVILSIGRTQVPYEHEGIVKAGSLLFWKLRKDLPEIRFKRDFKKIDRAVWPPEGLNEGNE